MRMEKVTFYKNDEDGTDELGNPILTKVNIGEHKGKITQWTSEEIALLDRTVTQSERKLITTAPKSVLKQADSLSIGDDTYTITQVKSDFTRWRLAHVKEYKI